MSTIQIKIEGVEEAIRSFARYQDGAHQAIHRAQVKAATATTTLAKRLCPVDTGRLRSSIRPRFSLIDLEAEVYTDVSYAPYVEFGTGERGAEFPPPDSPGGYDLDWPGQYAQPFLWPAWEAIRPYYIADCVAALRDFGYGTENVLRDELTGRFVG